MAPRGEASHDVWSVAEAKARLSEVIDPPRANRRSSHATSSRARSSCPSKNGRARPRGKAPWRNSCSTPPPGAELDLDGSATNRAISSFEVLLDTNVLSETRRPEPDRRVLEWLDRLDEDRAFISVVTLAEIRRGVALMAHGRRRDALAKWLAGDLIDRFASQS